MHSDFPADSPLLHQFLFSTDYQRLKRSLVMNKNLLIIQDLDGVCMGLVRDPLTRTLDPDYINASKLLAGHFYVLTNGEHIGGRGLNQIVDTALGAESQTAAHQSYLPGLAGGGVQWQDQQGRVTHPGVSDEELTFLRSVPDKAKAYLTSLLNKAPYNLSNADIDLLCHSAILDNLVSPTININVFHQHFQQPELYLQLQKDLKGIMQALLDEADVRNLSESFFIHYAPNLGRDAQGERIKFARGQDSGTTDFQFMLQGAIKEVGVLVILNHYYFEQTGHYPLGESFNARTAPRDQEKLLALAEQHFDPQQMPRIIGVGDTVTSNPQSTASDVVLRGGSDRGFLTLVQALGARFQSDNAVLYVDSSGGELDRPGLQLDRLNPLPGSQPNRHHDGICDQNDPLNLNFVFANGHQQYITFFRDLAAAFANA